MKTIRGRPFQAGNRYGRGRPKGSRNKKTLFLQDLLNGYGEPLVMTCIQNALQGDRHAMRLCMERLIGPQREGVLSFPSPPVRNTSDLDVAMKRLIRAITSGEVPPGQAEAVSNVLETQRRILETRDILDRIERLEKQSHEKQAA